MNQLFEYAEKEIEFSLPPPGSETSTSTKEHLNAVWKATGKKPKPLAEQPPLPELFAHLWEYWLELNNTEALTFSEIEAWSRLTGRNIVGREALIIKQIDGIKWKVINGRNLNTRHPRKERRRGSR